MKFDAQVDMLKFRTYFKIDLNETPVVALSCRHFFTNRDARRYIYCSNHASRKDAADQNRKGTDETRKRMRRRRKSRIVSIVTSHLNESAYNYTV